MYICTLNEVNRCIIQNSILYVLENNSKKYFHCFNTGNIFCTYIYISFIKSLKNVNVYFVKT